MNGYGTGLDKMKGYLTFAEDAEAKRRLIAMSKEKRFLASYDKKFLRNLWVNMCLRRFTVVENKMMESLRERKTEISTKSEIGS